MVKKIVIYTSIAILGIVVGLLLMKNKQFNSDNSNNGMNFITNFAFDKSKLGGDFVLTKHDGTEFKSSFLMGKPTLMYFGFTHCPDFCPTSLQVMDKIAQKIDINRVFISVDPQRDTVDMLNNYVHSYQQGLIGLTGTTQQIDTVAKQYMIYYSLNKKSDNDDAYIVDHTTYLYLLDKQGKIIAFIRPEATPNQIIRFIKENL